MATLAEHQTQVEQAREILNAGRRALLRPDGGRLYSDLEHDERTTKLERDFRQTISTAAAAAKAASQEAAATLDRAEVDPLHGLNNDELQRAALLVPLLEADASALPLSELVRRAEVALEAGRGDRAAWLRVLEGRSRELRSAARQGHLNRDRSISTAAVTLETLRERFRDSLVDPAKRRAIEERAREQASAATAVIVSAGAASYFETTYGPRPAGWRGV